MKMVIYQSYHHHKKTLSENVCVRSHHCRVDFQKEEQDGLNDSALQSVEWRQEPMQVRQEANVNKEKSLAPSQI